MTTLFSLTGLILVLMQAQTQAQSQFNIPWLLILSWLVLAPVLRSGLQFSRLSVVRWKEKWWFYTTVAIFLASVTLCFYSITWATIVAGVPALIIALYFLHAIVFRPFG